MHNFSSLLKITLHISYGLSVHHQEFKTVHTATSMCQTDSADCLLAGTRWNLFPLVPASKPSTNVYDIDLMLYVQSWTPNDGRKGRPKHVERYSKIKYIWETVASGWFYYRNNWVVVTVHCSTFVILHDAAASVGSDWAIIREAHFHYRVPLICVQHIVVLDPDWPVQHWLYVYV